LPGRPMYAWLPGRWFCWGWWCGRSTLATVCWTLARDSAIHLGHDLRERHYFHWRHRRVLAPLAVVAGLAASWIARLRIPLIALPQDSVVAVATLAYFSGVHGRFKLPPPVTRTLAVGGSRECLVGALFAVGCVLPAWSMDPVWNSPVSPVRLLSLPAIYFSALAWLNVRAITHWEAAGARRGDLRVGQAALWLAVAGLAIAVWMLPVQARAAELVAAGAVSALLIAWLDRRREDFGALTLRAAVDLVLLTPLVLVAMAR
jgi:hypothetical protein